MGRLAGGIIAAIAIDSDLASVSANHDTIPSAKAVKDALKLNGTNLYETSSVVLAADNAGRIYRINSAGALTVTIPAVASVNIPLNSEFRVARWGTGSVTIVAASGVTLRSAGGLASISAQYGVITLKHITTDSWLIYGDLA